MNEEIDSARGVSESEIAVRNSTNAIDPIRGGNVLSHQQKLRAFLQAATSENTRRSYRSAIRQFERWGGQLPTTASVLVQYIVARSDQLNPQTLSLHLTAIKQWHIYQGLRDPVSDPLVRKTLEGIRRTHGKPKLKAQALRVEQLLQMVNVLGQKPNSTKSLRDCALILIGYFGAFRRSELVAITVEDLKFEPEGVLIHLPRSKTDQSGIGQIKAIPYAQANENSKPGQVCPVQSLKTWLAASKITEGPVFRAINRWGQMQSKPLGASAVNDVLKSLGRDCGFDFVPNLSSHSLRRGLSTSAARENISFEWIKKQGGWKSDTTVWEYIDEGRQFSDNVGHVLIDKLNKERKP